MSGLVYVFEGVELDSARREIRHGDQRRDLTPQSFDTLEYLLRNANTVVSKDQLINDLWPNTVVTDASVSQAIRKVRAVLEECGVDPAIIRTQHGHGYRLDCNVEVIGGEMAVSPALSDNTSRVLSELSQGRPFKIGVVVALLGGILVTAANISEIASWFVPDETLVVLEETRETLLTTDAKIDELVVLLKNQAALSGTEIGPESERTIQQALRAIIESGDRRKAAALDQLEDGNIDEAAAAIVAVAREQSVATGQTIEAAAASWREAGAIYSLSNFDEAVRSYEAAYELRPRDPINALELAFSYMHAGRTDEASVLFNEVFALDPTPGIRADALRGLGMIDKDRGEYADAAAQLAEAMTLTVDSNDTRRKIQILWQMGEVSRAQGDNDGALRQITEARGLADELGDRRLQAETLRNLGVLMAVTEQYDEARELFTRAYEIFVDLRDLRGQATTIGNLGGNALMRGDLDAAELYLVKSIALGEQLGWKRSIMLALVNLGGIETERGNFDAATEALLRAHAIATEIGSDEMSPIILSNLGEVSFDRGDNAEACRYWAEALPILEEMEHGAALIVEENRADADCPELSGPPFE